MSKRKPTLQAYFAKLDWRMPAGWDKHFNQVGRGVRIQCPHCDERPPKHVIGYGRWRWMAAHISTAHRARTT